MKSAFIATISGGYMFSLNCSFNAMKFYGTEADFHVVYHESIPQEYMDICSASFPFKIVWHQLKQRDDKHVYGDLYHAFFAEKYWMANHIKDDYDAVCIIDGDLFLCGNMNEQFRLAFEEKKFITADHLHSGMPLQSMFTYDPQDIKDRNVCALADFPVFFDPKLYSKFIQDWYEFTFEDNHGKDERNHPLIAFNRSVRLNVPLEQIVVLDGNQWVCDINYWERRYIVDEHQCIMCNPQHRVYSIHNRWWKEGRANNEIIPNRNDSPNFHNAVHNFNSIRDFMVKFNDMTPSTRWPHYEPMVFK